MCTVCRCPLANCGTLYCVQVDELLGGSSLLPRAKTIIAAAVATWKEVAPLVQQAEADGLCPAGMFSHDAITWAGILLTRLFILDNKASLPALVPLGDMLNHSCSTQCYLDWDDGYQALVAIAGQDYQPGQQVRWKWWCLCEHKSMCSC